MTTESRSAWNSRHLAWLLGLFLLALLPRLYSAQTLGWHWDAPGSFTLVNFDEAGSCRAALDGFNYSGFIGRQTIALAELLGHAPDPGIVGNERAVKAYCHSAEHILVARSYSAFAGALTVVALAVIALLLVPSQPAVAWTAGGLLALSGFHISESHSGTVDAPSVFFIYTFIAVLIYAVGRRSRAGLALSPLFLVPAVWAKYWVFALFAYLALLPEKVWRYLSHGMSAFRIALVVLATAVFLGLATNQDFRDSGYYYLLATWYLVIPWRGVHRPMTAFWLLLPLVLFLIVQVGPIEKYTSGGADGRFGTGYGAIGWNKWLRNLVNLPAVLLVGLGIPACLFIPAGIRRAFRAEGDVRAWLCLLPFLAFALFMAFLAPVTYYRHYLALLPVAALLSACGLFATRWADRRWFMALFFAWPALLALDLVRDYHDDPRRELRPWFEQHRGERFYLSYYVNPPPEAVRGAARLFRPEYAFGDAAALQQAGYLILSENWYDTAFANELNGPVVSHLDRLVKTTPEYARFYRDALAGRHPNLILEESFDVTNFMPELLLHRWLYGTFQLFVGDIRILRVVD
jgi:hypothetical protein